VELSKYSWAMDRPGYHGNLSIPPSPRWGNTATDDMEENWEKEATVKQSYDPKKKASNAPVLRYVQGATPSQRKEFRAKEKVRLETMQQGGLNDSMNTSRDNSKDEKSTTRPSLKRDSATAPLGPLRRPTIGGEVDGGSSRPGSVTSALLEATLGRDVGLSRQRRGSIAIGSCPVRRPGCIPRAGEYGGYTNITRESMAGVDTTTDTLDNRLGQLALGRGRGLLQQIPLRRPSGLGRM